MAKDSESYVQAKQRSRQAADKLAALAGGPDSILLLGHGFMNRLIARQLLRQGWLEVSKTGSGYWGFAVYEKAE
ncbi:histidine phosphatase family protein [Pseudomonas oryzihabitans]|uniref:histidine phosphatase family protein n=1 Tax=Pseudomonas oryzihabitans TaxID=47885 RepID=UPI001CC303D6|nr:histidine phosphatase family protein [Pseudomonas oryzihabitans]